MRAPFAADPFTTATAEPRFASDFMRFTSCAVPNEGAAGRFSEDIMKEDKSEVVPDSLKYMSWI